MKFTLKNANANINTNKVAAIKALRNITGQGLKEAKDSIEAVWGDYDGKLVIETFSPRLLEGNRIPKEEADALKSQGILISNGPCRKNVVLNATRSSVKMAIDEGEWDLAISLIQVLKEHDNG